MPPRQHSVQALKLRARAQTALPEQSMLLRHRAVRKETEERCSDRSLCLPRRSR